MANLYVFVGLPGSGKTTFSVQLAQELDAKIVCFNEIISNQDMMGNMSVVETIIAKELEKAFETGHDVVYDAANLTRLDRKKIIDSNRHLAEKIICCFMFVPFDVSLKRLLQDTKLKISPNSLEIELDRLAGVLTANMPEENEGFDEIRLYSGVEVRIFIGDGRVKKCRIYAGGVSPEDFLALCVSDGYHWELNFSLATLEEKRRWLTADVFFKAALAKREGRLIYFENQAFQDISQWQDAIVASGKIPVIIRDDKTEYRVCCHDSLEKAENFSKDQYNENKGE